VATVELLAVRGQTAKWIRRDGPASVAQLLQQSDFFRERKRGQTSARLAFALQNLSHPLAHSLPRNLCPNCSHFPSKRHRLRTPSSLPASNTPLSMNCKIRL